MNRISDSMLAREVSQYLTEHIDDRVTLDRLTSEFSVSGTRLKNCFRAEYGMPIYAWTRRRKMYGAAELLRATDMTVLDIAGRFGYDNGGKFASAFRDVTGMTPTQYRASARKSAE